MIISFVVLIHEGMLSVINITLVLRRAVKSSVSQSLDHRTAVSGVGSSPALTASSSACGCARWFFLGFLPFLPT